MALEAKLSWTQTTDGKKIIYRDDTNWTEEALDPSDYVRTVQIYSGKDATNALLDTLIFTGGALTVEYVLDEDKFLSSNLSFTVAGDDYGNIINFGTTVNEYNLLTNILLRNNCGCDKGADQNVRFGFIYLKLAEKSVITGNSGAFNRFIEQSRTWLAN